MKRLMKYSVLTLLACLTALTAAARVYTIDAGNARGDLTQYLRQQCQRVQRADTLVLNIPKGEFTLNGTVEFKCNTVIKGAGTGKSTLVLNDGRDTGGFKAFPDDSFLKFHGELEHPITVDISDLSLKLKEHKGIWWNADASQEKLAVKIYHAQRVDIHRVNSHMSNAIITNYDLRVCSNVSITDCVITNYNNAEVGGCLWLRGETRNVDVKRNKFYKYGKDEALGLFSNVVNVKGNVLGDIVRENIHIEGNEFHYGYDGKDKDRELVLANLITLESDANNTWKTTLRDISIKGNKISIDDQCLRSILIRIAEKDKHQGIVIESNQIVNADLRSDKQYYRYDLDIVDKSHDMDTIRIIGNSLTNHNSVLNPSKAIGYSFIYLERGNVALQGNKIVSTVTTDRYTGRGTGVQLLWCGQGGGSATLRDNVCKGLKCLATVGAGKGAEHFTLNAFNNYLAGDIRVYCSKVNRLDLNFTGNTMVSNDTHFFLQEFASKGDVTFKSNDVTVKSGDGRFLTHYNDKSTDSMKFERLEVSGNVFRGVKGEQDMFKKMTHVKKRNVRSNKYGK